jgi:hypothetical protein
MTNKYTDNPAEYLGCTDEEWWYWLAQKRKSEFNGKSEFEIKEKLNEMFVGEPGLELIAKAIYKKIVKENKNEMRLR